MKLVDLIGKLELEVWSARNKLDADVTGGYASDLLSDVIGNSKEGHIWVTLQIHPNTVAVAVMKDLAAIVLVGGREPEAETVEKAEVEGIPILGSRLPAFELVGRLYELGVKGVRTEKPV